MRGCDSLGQGCDLLGGVARFVGCPDRKGDLLIDARPQVDDVGIGDGLALGDQGQEHFGLDRAFAVHGRALDGSASLSRGFQERRCDHFTRGIDRGEEHTHLVCWYHELEIAAGLDLGLGEQLEGAAVGNGIGVRHGRSLDGTGTSEVFLAAILVADAAAYGHLECRVAAVVFTAAGGQPQSQGHQWDERMATGYETSR